MKDSVLEHIHNIRDEIGKSARDPEITRVWESQGAIRIECEDRADKSIAIGSGGWVAGKLSKCMGGKVVTVSSRLDNIIKTRRLLRSRRAIAALPHNDARAALMSLLEEKGTDMPCVVLGEESLWICGMMEDRGSTPLLLHTGFIDPRVKEAYSLTDTKQVDTPATPYLERLEVLKEHALRVCDEMGFGLVLGPFEFQLSTEDDIVLANPATLLAMGRWEMGSSEKKRFRPPLFNLSDENREYIVHRTLREVWEGRCEPSVAARMIYVHWPHGRDVMPDWNPVPDQYIVSYRRKNAVRRAQRYSEALSEALASFGHGTPTSTGLTAVVAWSGGVDSTACIPLCREIGISPDAVTVGIPHIDVQALKARAEELQVSLTVLPAPNDLTDIENKAHKGNIHPCGMCHGGIEQEVIGYATARGYDLVVFGDMLSVGAQSVAEEGNVLVLNLPAALGLSKGYLEKITGMGASNSFGCPLLQSVHTAHPHTRRVSLQRVMRELRCQAISPRYAATLIAAIMR